METPNENPVGKSVTDSSKEAAQNKKQIEYLNRFISTCYGEDIIDYLYTFSKQNKISKEKITIVEYSKLINEDLDSKLFLHALIRKDLIRFMYG